MSAAGKKFGGGGDVASAPADPEGRGFVEIVLPE